MGKHSMTLLHKTNRSCKISGSCPKTKRRRSLRDDELKVTLGTGSALRSLQRDLRRSTVMVSVSNIPFVCGLNGLITNPPRLDIIVKGTLKKRWIRRSPLGYIFLLCFWCIHFVSVYNKNSTKGGQLCAQITYSFKPGGIHAYIFALLEEEVLHSIQKR